MEIKKILILLFLSISGIIYSQFGDSTFLNLEKYKYVAKQELVFRYNFINKNDTIFDKKINLAVFYKLEELKVYSIPIFKVKSVKEHFQFIDLINFESNPNYQEVIIEGNNKITSFFVVSNPNINEIIDSFTRVSLFLIYYKFDYYYNEVDIPNIVGGITRDYFTKERFEKDYFCFRVEGLKGLFFYKDEKIYYATKKSPKNKLNDDYNSYKDYYNDMKTEIFIVDDKFEYKIKEEVKQHPLLKKRISK